MSSSPVFIIALIVLIAAASASAWQYEDTPAKRGPSMLRLLKRTSPSGDYEYAPRDFSPDTDNSELSEIEMRIASYFLSLPEENRIRLLNRLAAQQLRTLTSQQSKRGRSRIRLL